MYFFALKFILKTKLSIVHDVHTYNDEYSEGHNNVLNSIFFSIYYLNCVDFFCPENVILEIKDTEYLLLILLLFLYSVQTKPIYFL